MRQFIRKYYSDYKVVVEPEIVPFRERSTNLIENSIQNARIGADVNGEKQCLLENNQDMSLSHSTIIYE